MARKTVTTKAAPKTVEELTVQSYDFQVVGRAGPDGELIVRGRYSIDLPLKTTWEDAQTQIGERLAAAVSRALATAKPPAIVPLAEVVLETETPDID